MGATRDPLVIVGGGLAGALAALAWAEARPEAPLLLLEGGARFGGAHTWSFFDSDLPPGAGAWVAALRPVRWARHRVRFPGRARVLEQPYSAIRSAALDALVRARLAPGQYRLDAPVASLAADAVSMASGEIIAASAVIDARGPGAAGAPMPGLALGWQKFLGLRFAAPAPEADCATVMDACVPQRDGYRFVYTLPLAADEVLVEDTYYSTSPALDRAALAAGVRAYAARAGIIGADIGEEVGVLPIVIDGDPDAFWPVEDRVARLGLAGGFFHPTTGYSLSLALANSLALAAEAPAGPALAGWTRARFLAHWRGGGYFRLLNRMLFHAAAPDARWRVFAHFYRLPEPTIARFYAGGLTTADKARILIGRPPVPIGAALRAMRGARA